MNPVMDKTKNAPAFSSHISMIFADQPNQANEILASGKAPERFELLKVGMWRTPWHGDIMITASDLVEYIDNFNAGYGVSGNDKINKLPINYAHAQWDKAAGWFVPAVEGDTLWATQVEWTPAAKQAIEDGEWKCISAEFCPAGRGGWIDPLDESHIVNNVLEGAALTNIPLFSKNNPVSASAIGGNGQTSQSVILINASNNAKESNLMQLQDILAKENDKLTDEERNFLVEHKAELNEDQLKKFGFETTSETVTETAENKEENKEENLETNNTTPTEIPAELATVAASIKAGTHVLVKADVLQRLEETDAQYRTKEAQSIVKAHIARGAIKADQLDVWTNKLVKADSKERQELETLLDNLNGNTAMGEEKGSDKGANVTGTALQEIKVEADKLIKEAKENGQVLDIGSAFSQILASKKDLADRYYQEING